MKTERERLAALDQSMNLYKTARQHLDNDPSESNVERYCLAVEALFIKVAEVAELDMAEAKERREPHAPVLVEPTPNDPAFYRAGQTGVERALPVADATTSTLHPAGRASLDDFNAEELQQLQAELDELERNDPAVAAAAANYDATVAGILAEQAAKPEACATCGGTGRAR